MPKRGKHPRLRVHVKRGKDGQVWTSYWYDHRGHGKPDEPLGTDRAAALVKWAEIHTDAPRMAGTLEEAFKAWERDRLPTYTNTETRRNYAKYLRALRPVFGAARWEEVTLPVLARYVRERSAKTAARHEMQLLNVVWNWSRTMGYTERMFPGQGVKGWKGAASVRQVEVSDEAFAALYKHADRCLRDALDIATATGLRVMDVIELRLSDVRGTELVVTANKTGKRGDFDLTASAVLLPLIERRKAMRGPEHLFLLADGRKPVTYRRLVDRFTKARAAAAKECPEVAGLFLRDMRKRAAALADDLQAASKLLQHSGLGVTQASYRKGDKLKPVR
jgi:integrase